MSKNIIEEELPAVSWGNGYVITENSPEYLVGRILQIVEALGLPQKQEESVKGLIRENVYRELQEYGVSIGRELNSAIRNKYFEKKQSLVGEPVPLIELKDIK